MSVFILKCDVMMWCLDSSSHCSFLDNVDMMANFLWSKIIKKRKKPVDCSDVLTLYVTKESCKSFEIIERPSRGVPALERKHTRGPPFNLVPADLNSHENAKKNNNTHTHKTILYYAMWLNKCWKLVKRIVHSAGPTVANNYNLSNSLPVVNINKSCLALQRVPQNMFVSCSQ